jgi:hypothetical protein
MGYNQLHSWLDKTGECVVPGWYEKRGRQERKEVKLTLHRLFLIEVIHHPLDPAIQPPGLGLLDDGPKILQHQTAGRMRHLAAELVQVVAHTAGNIHQENGLRCLLRALDQALLDGVEALVHPRGAALAVAAHVVVELLAVGRVGHQVLEHVELGVVGVLQGAVRDAVGRLVIVLGRVLGELAQRRHQAAGAG